MSRTIDNMTPEDWRKVYVIYIDQRPFSCYRRAYSIQKLTLMQSARTRLTVRAPHFSALCTAVWPVLIRQQRKEPNLGELESHPDPPTQHCMACTVT